jgi:alpha-tubulin suppressor-like RCC1 family protein
VLCSDGTLAAWGINGTGELGNNSRTNSKVPTGVLQSGVLAGKTVTAIAAGGFHNLALCSDGTLVAWGNNVEGALGDNSTTDRLVPVAVNVASGTSALFGKSVIAIAAGRTHSLAVCSDGTVATWGWNANGELGDNSTTNRSVPVSVNMANGISALFDKSVIAVAAGSQHNLALCSDGTLVAWGYNGFGQLGNNDFSGASKLVPVAVNRANGTSALFGKTILLLQRESITALRSARTARWLPGAIMALASWATTAPSVALCQWR